MKFKELDQLEEKIAAKQLDLTTIFDEARTESGPDLMQVKSLSGSSQERVEEVRRMNAELTALADEAAPLIDLKRIAMDAEGYGAAGAVGDAGDARKKEAEIERVVDVFMKSATYTQRKHGSAPESAIALKTLMSTSAGFAPAVTRSDVIVPIAQRPVELVDLIPKILTNEKAIVWMEQTTRTNNAAETSEGATKPEAVIVYTERTNNVRKVAVTLPVTDEQLADVPQLQSILEVDLETMVRQRLSNQIASGDGIDPNLLGVLNVGGIQTQAKGADPVPDAVYKAIVKVLTVGQAVPNAFVTNPLDWQDVRLLRTTDGIYIWGNPSEAGPERIWGLQVVLAQGMTQNTGVVGDFANFSRLAIRQDVTVDIGLVNDQFVKNQQTLRAEMRAALLFLRPAAFCSVTGI